MKKCCILLKTFSHPYNVLPAIFLRGNPVREKTHGDTHPIKFLCSLSFSFIFHRYSPICFVYFFPSSNPKIQGYKDPRGHHFF